MKRWLSQTRVDRGEDLVAERPVLRLQIEQRNLGARAAVIERRFPARPTAPGRCADRPALPSAAGVGVEDELDLLAGVGGQIDHHGNPAAVRRVVERIDVLREQLARRRGRRTRRRRNSTPSPSFVPRLRLQSPATPSATPSSGTRTCQMMRLVGDRCTIARFVSPLSVASIDVERARRRPLLGAGRTRRAGRRARRRRSANSHQPAATRTRTTTAVRTARLPFIPACLR